MKIRLLIFFFAAALFAVACSEKPTQPSSGDVVMTINGDTFQAGDTIVVTVTNNLDHAVYVSVCPGAEPQKEKNHGEWENVWPPDLCPAVIPPELAPGETMTRSFDPDWGHGTFRIIQGIFDDQAAIKGRIIYSKKFRVM